MPRIRGGAVTAHYGNQYAPPPSLVPLTTSYHDYFPHAETNTFRRHYAAIQAPYVVDPAAATTSAASYDFTRMIYATDQGGAS